MTKEFHKLSSYLST